MAIVTGQNQTPQPEKFAPASSFIELVEYDPNARTMDITFKSGTKHRYFMVYPATFASFKQSPSHSIYYAKAIKGNLIGARLIDHNIGRKESTPLHHVTTQRSHLDRGIREQRAREKRNAGTIHRAFERAAVV